MPKNNQPTSRPLGDAIAQLTPLLGSLARLVARGSSLGEAELRTLLMSADNLEDDPATRRQRGRH